MQYIFLVDYQLFVCSTALPNDATKLTYIVDSSPSASVTPEMRQRPREVPLGGNMLVVQPSSKEPRHYRFGKLRVFHLSYLLCMDIMYIKRDDMDHAK